jgi:hypothetical protein
MAFDRLMQDPIRTPDSEGQKIHANLSAARLSWYMALASGDRRLALRRERRQSVVNDEQQCGSNSAR